MPLSVHFVSFLKALVYAGRGLQHLGFLTGSIKTDWSKRCCERDGLGYALEAEMRVGKKWKGITIILLFKKKKIRQKQCIFL